MAQSYIKSVWEGIYTAWIGMRITLKHLFGKKVTMQYPDKHHPVRDKTMPPNARNRLYLDFDLCNGCNTCARNCPVSCITIETVKGTKDDPPPPLKNGKKRTLWVTKYDIDFALCCFCGLCTDGCPTDAIMTTVEFEYSTYDRKDLIYAFSPMTEEEIKMRKDQLKKEQAEKKKAMAAKKAAAEKEEQEEDNE